MNPAPDTLTTDDRHAERVLARSCAYCGQTFRPGRPHQRHCRPSCRLAAFKTRRRVAEPLAIGLWQDDEARD